MSFLIRQVAHCDMCGHEWITNKVPSHCAKCKSRKWNQGQGVSLAQARRFETNYAPDLCPGCHRGVPASGALCVYCAEAKDIESKRYAPTRIGSADGPAISKSLGHAETCKCLMCQPPKPPKSSS